MNSHSFSHTPMRRRSVGPFLLACGALHALARVSSAWAQSVGRAPLRVGPGAAFARIADALAAAQDGDTIEVLPGEYNADTAVIHQRRLRIVGIGARPVVNAAGRHAEDKAIWVLRDGDVHIENIAFQGARVPQANGAAIRLEGGRLHLLRCHFSDNQMGVLTGNQPDCELVVDGCEFSHAPVNPDGLPHLLYVGRIGRFVLKASHLHHGRTGHLVKSRARETTVIGNQLDDGPQGLASYEIDLPDGGLALITHNLIGQGSRSSNAVMVSYGAELRRGPVWRHNRLEMRHNRMLNRMGEVGVFVRAWHQRLPPGTAVELHDNHLLGGGGLELGPNGSSRQDLHGPLPS